jgi:hypothetical protein
MKFIKIFPFLLCLTFCGCLLLNYQNGMGVQSFKNVNLSMIEIYKVLKNNFPEYLTENNFSENFRPLPIY